MSTILSTLLRESVRCDGVSTTPHAVKISKDTYEDDDLIDTINELRREVVADRAHDEFAGSGLDGAFAHVVEESRTEVARHDDDGVAEVDDAALAVREPSVVEHLQEELVELARRLLDLVDEHDRVRLAADVLRELATLVVTDVARRRTNETSDRVLLRVFGAVDTDHGFGRVEEQGCEL